MTRATPLSDETPDEPPVPARGMASRCAHAAAGVVGDRGQTLSGRCPFVKTASRLLERRVRIAACRARRRVTGTSRSLERGLAILSSFNSDRPLIGVSELSRDLALSRSTAHRYFTTLAQLGYLQQDRDSKRYRLGPRVLDLGFSAINSMDVREIAAPHLRELADETRLHGQPRDPRGHRRRLHRALPRRRGRGSARSTSTCTSAPGCPPTARRWARRSSRSCPRTSARI